MLNKEHLHGQFVVLAKAIVGADVAQVTAILQALSLDEKEYLYKNEKLEWDALNKGDANYCNTNGHKLFVHGDSILHLAIKMLSSHDNNAETGQLLRVKDNLTEAPCYTNKTASHAILTLLLEQRPRSVDLNNYKNQGGFTLLHCAVQSHIDALRLLLGVIPPNDLSRAVAARSHNRSTIFSCLNIDAQAASTQGEFKRLLTAYQAYSVSEVTQAIIDSDLLWRIASWMNHEGHKRLELVSGNNIVSTTSLLRMANTARMSGPRGRELVNDVLQVLPQSDVSRVMMLRGSKTIAQSKTLFHEIMVDMPLQASTQGTAESVAWLNQLLGWLTKEEKVAVFKLKDANGNTPFTPLLNKLDINVYQDANAVNKVAANFSQLIDALPDEVLLEMWRSQQNNRLEDFSGQRHLRPAGQKKLMDRFNGLEQLVALQEACAVYHAQLHKLPDTAYNKQAKLLALNRLIVALEPRDAASEFKQSSHEKIVNFWEAFQPAVFHPAQDSASKRFIETILRILASVATLGIYPAVSAAQSRYQRGTCAFWKSEHQVFVETVQKYPVSRIHRTS